MGRSNGASGANNDYLLINDTGHGYPREDVDEDLQLLPGAEHRLRTLGGGDIPLVASEPVYDGTSRFRWLSWLLSKIMALCRLLLKPIAFAAVLREPLFSMLMYFALVTSIKQIINIFIYSGIIGETGNILIQLFAALLSVYNLTNDWISVSPADAVDKFLNSKREKNNYLYAFKTSLLITAIVLSFPPGSCSDAIPLSAYINHIANELTRNIVKYLTLAVIILLGEVYYAMLSDRNLQDHSNAFFKACKEYGETFQWIKENSLEFIEALSIIACNVFYRPALFGSVTSLTISEYIGLDSTSFVSKSLIGVVMIATGIITLFSRSLGIFRTIVPHVPELERNKTIMRLIDDKLSPLTGWSATKHVLTTSVYPMLRGLGIGLITFALLERETIPSLVQAVVAISFGVVIFGLSFFTQFRSLLRTLPYPQGLSAEGPMDIMIETPLPQDSNVTLLTPMTYQDALAGFERLREVKERKSPGLLTFVKHVDITTRFARCLSIPVFLLVLFLTFSFIPTVAMLAGTALFLSAGVAQCESSFYRPGMVHTTTRLLVNMDLLTQCDAREHRVPATTMVGRIYEAVRSFGLPLWRSGADSYQRASAPIESDVPTIAFDA